MKLVNTAPAAHVVSPRPYQTYYYGLRAAETDWSRIGRASSVRGAVRAAVGHIIDRTYHSAVIHNEEGLRIIHVLRRKNTIVIIGV